MGHLVPVLQNLIETECRHGWLLELFIFLVVAVVLLALWYIVDHAIPKVNYFLRLERRRQAKQRAKLFYHSQFRQGETKTVAAAPDNLRRRKDFRNTPTVDSVDAKRNIRFWTES